MTNEERHASSLKLNPPRGQNQPTNQVCIVMMTLRRQVHATSAYSGGSAECSRCLRARRYGTRSARRQHCRASQTIRSQTLRQPCRASPMRSRCRLDEHCCHARAAGVHILELALGLCPWYGSSRLRRGSDSSYCHHLRSHKSGGMSSRRR